VSGIRGSRQDLVGIASSATRKVWGLAWAFLCEWGNHAADNHSAGNIYLADAVLDMLSATFAERLLSETPIPGKRILRERVCAIADFVLHALLFVTVTLCRSRAGALSGTSTTNSPRGWWWPTPVPVAAWGVVG
jgi:hypothetical protein